MIYPGNRNCQPRQDPRRRLSFSRRAGWPRITVPAEIRLKMAPERLFAGPWPRVDFLCGVDNIGAAKNTSGDAVQIGRGFRRGHRHAPWPFAWYVCRLSVQWLNEGLEGWEDLVVNLP